MNCRNCNSSLDERINYCPLCGAKIVRNRLTLKNIWSDINAQFLSIDNKLFQTFIHLFSKPEVVINGFIEGTRKKYVNVIQYFAIALTLVGLQVFLMNTFFREAMVFDSPFFDALNQNAKAQENNPFNNFDYEQFNNYQSLIYTMSVPISAISTWIAYWIAGIRRFNFTEHVVINLYYSAQVIIITAFITILFLCLGIDFLLTSSLTFLFTLVYFFYVLKRVFNTSILETVAHYMLVMVMFVILFIIAMVIAVIIGIIIVLVKKGAVVNTVN
ncbi:DUF3667 domain-containing protein [uncultured Psychroserpens sp.]|uniref:DUF3667 domain-containing protein n=1 Tax=uncultured Psychroserpens sp. TaxID=255436 RepID=UPI00261A134E|nr:DUF3667 domain-containing protein [uncultured Psychroserpens sp.]